MRTIFFMIITMLMVACNDQNTEVADKQYPTLNHQALKPLFLRHTQDFRTAALEQLKQADYAAYYDLKQNPDQLQQKLQPIIEQLKQQAENAPTEFVYSTSLVFGQYDQASQTLTSGTPKFNDGKISFAAASTLKPYPKYITLLLANSEIAHNLVITPSQWQTIKQSLTVEQGNRLNSEFIIEVKALQNQQFFQAIIKQIKVFSSQNELLLHLVEPRTDEDIIANSLLPEGITLNLIPIHNLDLYGHRLLDPISDTLENRQICTKNGSQKGHLSLSCRYWHGQKLIILADVVGGKVTRLRLQSSAKLSPEEQQKILNHAAGKLGKSQIALTNATTWEHYGVKISFNRQALEQQADDDQPRTIFDLQPISWLNYIKE